MVLFVSYVWGVTPPQKGDLVKKKEEPMSNRNSVKALRLHKETIRLLEEGTDLAHVVGGTRPTLGDAPAHICYLN
jgi:hypothetical protein